MPLNGYLSSTSRTWLVFADTTKIPICVTPSFRGSLGAASTTITEYAASTMAFLAAT